MKRRKVIIMGAAGRDFHNFNVVYRDNPEYEVVAFTATQIPFIERRSYPAKFAGPLYPKGISIYPEPELEELIHRLGAEQVVFAYSDVSHEQVMHAASRCLALGADFKIFGPEKTMLPSKKPVISVCAVRTGCGKSGITKYVMDIVRSAGYKPVAIRHPMPYCDLSGSRFQRFERSEDLDLSSCTIEEREEFEPLLSSGVVYSGIDLAGILHKAGGEADIIVWDGGNNDFPFIKSDLEIVVFDPHRPGHELTYHAGETNLRRADIAVINKVNTASPENIAAVENNLRAVNPRATVIRVDSRILVDRPELIKGRRVLVVEDGPTLTHGGMAFGAGLLAAIEYGAGEVIDPRPFAKGTINKVFTEYPHIGNVLPAVGYAPAQMEELRSTIEAALCDLVIIATPVDLRKLLELSKKVIRVGYRIEETDGRLKGIIEEFIAGRIHKPDLPTSS